MDTFKLSNILFDATKAVPPWCFPPKDSPPVQEVAGRPIYRWRNPASSAWL